MDKEMRNFADDLDSGNKSADTQNNSGLNQYTELADKWNSIQEEYIAAYPDLDMEDLYFESGGFEGVLEKISKVRGKKVAEIRTELEQWE